MTLAELLELPYLAEGFAGIAVLAVAVMLILFARAWRRATATTLKTAVDEAASRLRDEGLGVSPPATPAVLVLERFLAEVRESEPELVAPPPPPPSPEVEPAAPPRPPAPEPLPEPVPEPPPAPPKAPVCVPTVEEIHRAYEGLAETDPMLAGRLKHAALIERRKDVEA